MTLTISVKVIWTTKPSSSINTANIRTRRLVSNKTVVPCQGPKLTFLARSRLAPKFSKVVAKAKKLGAIKKKKDS